MPDDDFASRVQGRLDRLDMTAVEAAALANLPAPVLERVLAGAAPPRGKRLAKLAEALSTTVAYLVGLDPDDPVPEEYLVEDQGELGLLAADEEALLLAYRRLDVPSRAALLLVVTRMSPPPAVDERAPRQGRSVASFPGTGSRTGRAALPSGEQRRQDTDELP